MRSSYCVECSAKYANHDMIHILRVVFFNSMPAVLIKIDIAYKDLQIGQGILLFLADLGFLTRLKQSRR
jgi:hypothetical protein